MCACMGGGVLSLAPGLGAQVAVVTYALLGVSTLVEVVDCCLVGSVNAMLEGLCGLRTT